MNSTRLKLRIMLTGIIFAVSFSLSAVPNFVLMGPPGCGKGTFSDFAKTKYGYHQISIGDILRWHQRQKTEIGLLCTGKKAKGEYLNDEIVFKLICDQVTTCCNKKIPFIIDNFPRNVNAFNFLMQLFKERGLGPKNVKFVYFKLNDQASIDRINGRSVCSDTQCARSYNKITQRPVIDGFCDKCQSPLILRPGDKESNTKRRLGLFRKNVEPLITTASLFGFEVLEIDATMPIDGCQAQYRELFSRFPQELRAKL